MTPKVVGKAVMRALSGRRIKPRSVVGKEAGAFVLLSRLPVGLRDRLVKSALGLTEALRPVGAVRSDDTWRQESDAR